VLHHGVLAPHSRWRARVVAYGREPPAPLAAEPAQAPAPAAQESSAPRSRAWSWAEPLRHTFAVDVLACPRCGGRMRVISTIEDPVVIRKILTHLGLPTEVSGPRPPPHDLFGWS
jgi:hypothetical protein